jgi:hypothetical protein
MHHRLTPSALRAQLGGSRAVRAFLVAAFALAVTAGTALGASATLYGHLNHDGSTKWFTTYRYHDHTGTIDAYIDNLPNSNGTLWLGLRNSSNQQFSNTQTWTTTGSKQFTRYNESSNQFAPINFAINGRMGSCGVFCDDDFGGTLYY